MARVLMALRANTRLPVRIHTRADRPSRLEVVRRRDRDQPRGQPAVPLRRHEALPHVPVATGQAIYPTPRGRFHIVVKWKNPWWYPPVQDDWAKGLKPVPPGPSNPLGTRWMGLNAPGVGIHGTDEPSSIGYSASHGCIRMQVPDAEWLFDHVDVGHDRLHRLMRVVRAAAVAAVLALLGLLVWDVAHSGARRDRRQGRQGSRRSPPRRLRLPLFGGRTGTFDLAAYRGKVVVLNFWASWCVDCKLEAKTLRDAAAKWGAKVGLRRRRRQRSDRRRAKRYMKRYDVNYAVVRDVDGSRAEHAGVSPASRRRSSSIRRAA